MNLVIQACSGRKHNLQNLPAFEIYDGVAYRVIKKTFRENPILQQKVKILILSAKYGLITSETIISVYEQRIDKKRAESLKMQIKTTWDEFSFGKNFENIFVNVGRDYLPALSLIQFPKSTIFAKGGIGFRNQQLKNYLKKG